MPRDRTRRLEEVFVAGRPERAGLTEGEIKVRVPELARRSRERPSPVVVAAASEGSVGAPSSEMASVPSDFAMVAREGAGSGSGDVLDKEEKSWGCPKWVGVESEAKMQERKREVRVTCIACCVHGCARKEGSGLGAELRISEAQISREAAGRGYRVSAGWPAVEWVRPCVTRKTDFHRPWPTRNFTLCAVKADRRVEERRM